MKNKKEITLELVQATLDESFIDAADSIHKLFSISVKDHLETMREDIATAMFPSTQK